MNNARTYQRRRKYQGQKAAAEPQQEGPSRAQGPLVQPQDLKVGAPNDKYEAEADHMADKVVNGPSAEGVQRKCDACSKEEAQREPLAGNVSPLVQRAPEEEPAAQPLAQRMEQEEPAAMPMAQRAEEEEQAQPIAQRAEEEEQAQPLAQRAPEEEPAAQPLAQRMEQEEPAAMPMAQRAEEEEQAQPIAQRAEEEEQAQPIAQRAEEEEQAQPLAQRAEEEEQAQPLAQRTEEEEQAHPANRPMESPKASKDPSRQLGRPSRKQAGVREATPWASQKIAATRGQGQKLPTETRRFMEQGFGADFNRVRIHNDETAHQLSKNLHAQAFTVGNDIYFNKGYFNPDTKSGQHLLAHELTHTIQQKGWVQRQTTGSGAASPFAGGPQNLTNHCYTKDRSGNLRFDCVCLDAAYARTKNEYRQAQEDFVNLTCGTPATDACVDQAKMDFKKTAKSDAIKKKIFNINRARQDNC